MISAILTDIEGTTSSLSFVKEILFPYARRHMADFVTKHFQEPKVAIELAAVQSLSEKPLSRDELIEQLLRWIDEDRKETPLKALQGMIWESGYQQGAFHGHIYPDAAQQLMTWKATGVGLYVFSSGSVKAQKLLFAHTEFGDLTPLFSGYFDTRIGAKKEAESYRLIAQRIGREPASILFLSDVLEELDAAREAGMATTWLVRTPPAPANPKRHPLAFQFGEIDLEKKGA